MPLQQRFCSTKCERRRRWTLTLHCIIWKTTLNMLLDDHNNHLQIILLRNIQICHCSIQRSQLWMRQSLAVPKATWLHTTCVMHLVRSNLMAQSTNHRQILYVASCDNVGWWGSILTWIPHGETEYPLYWLGARVAQPKAPQSCVPVRSDLFLGLFEP